MKKSVYLALASSVALLCAQGASAAVSFVAGDGSVRLFKDSSLSWTVNYNGLVDGSPYAGLSSKIDFAFVGVSTDDKTYNFTYQIHNNSTVTSRVTMFGMNIDPDILSAVSTGVFPKDGSGNAPGIGSVDVCFHDRNGGGSNCAGGAGTGVGNGDSSSDNPLGTFALTFESVPTEFEVKLDSFYTRYQSVGPDEELSGVGFGTPVVPNNPDAIPEPATWAMMIGGFGLIGGAFRRRRRVAATSLA